MRNGDDSIRGQVESLAGELRLIQVDFADAPPEERRERLADRLGQALAEVHPADRRPLLEALRDRFPVLGSAVPTPVVVRKGLDEALLGDWRFLLERLVALPLSEEERRAATAALRQAGLCPPALSVPSAPPPEPPRQPAAAASTAAWPEEAAREAVRDLGLAPTAELDAAGVLRALVVLQGFAAKAEKALVASIDEMHPKTKGKRGAQLRERLKWVVVGGEARMHEFRAQLDEVVKSRGDESQRRRWADGQLPEDEAEDILRDFLSAALEGSVRELARLQGAYMGGAKVGAPQAARDLHGALAPEQIRGSVGNNPKRCWEEFERRWELQSDDEISERVRAAIAEAILTLIA